MNDTPVTFFVDVNGSDAWSGKQAHAAPQGSDGPFVTLARARQAVREVKAAQGGKLTQPVRVQVGGGKYFLPEPLLLNTKDSGEAGCPVTWCGTPGETTILSGGCPVSGWEPYRGKILRAALPGSKGGKWKFRQLFYHGERQVRARTPKVDPSDPLYSGWALLEGAASEETSTTTFIYKPGQFKQRWAKPAELEVRYWADVGGWGSIAPVKRIDESRRCITLVHGGWQFDVPGWYQPVRFTPDNRFCVENGLEDLQLPGEWCFDSEEGMLYFYPPDDALLKGEDSGVVAPALDCLIDIRGASWVNISGFTFTETADGDNFHHEGVEGAGAMTPRPGWKYGSDAVHLKDAEYCRIEGNHFRAVGGNAVYLEGHTYRNVIQRNEISQAGANGICLMGTRLKHPLANEVSDNHIHHCGVLNQYTAGVFSGMSDANLISHNTIEYLPHHAINLSNSPTGRNVVEYNRIRFVDQEVADSAAINCWMEEPPTRDAQRCGHIIRFNWIADVYGCEVTDGKVGPAQRMPTSGIYLDNYSSNCVVSGNIILRCTHAGIVIHAGKNNWIENNIIVNCQASIRLQDYVSGMPFWQPMAGFMTCNHLLHNISYQERQPAYVFFLYTWTERAVARSDENIYYQAGDGAYRVEQYGSIPDGQRVPDLAAWRALGFDPHSLVADPLFVDPAHDDYHLLPASPALKVGFQDIEAEKMGIRAAT